MTLNRTGSQCSLTSVGVMWSYFATLLTRRAARFCKCCSLLSWTAGTPTNPEGKELRVRGTRTRKCVLKCILFSKNFSSWEEMHIFLKTHVYQFSAIFLKYHFSKKATSHFIAIFRSCKTRIICGLKEKVQQTTSKKYLHAPQAMAKFLEAVIV